MDHSWLRDFNGRLYMLKIDVSALQRWPEGFPPQLLTSPSAAGSNVKMSDRSFFSSFLPVHFLVGTLWIVLVPVSSIL